MNISNFKIRQHLIYIVLSIVVGLLVKEGVFFAIFVGFVYFKRFPKTYWIYFLISIGAVVYVNFLADSIEQKSEEVAFLKEAKVVEIKTQNEKKQTAKIMTEAGNFYLTLATSEPRLSPGDVIEVQAESMPLTHPTIPHAFNFKNYLLSSGMIGTVYLKQTNILRHDWSIREYQSQLAHWIKERYPTLTATYLQSWVLGVKHDLAEEMNDCFSTLGVLHLFAVSGLHVGLLVGIVSYLLKRLGIIEELANFLLICLIIVFVIVSGGSASIIRAGGMFVLTKLNSQFKWRLSSLDSFSIMFLMNFLFFPLQVYQSGFIYTYWLTFCLILCQNVMKRLSGKSAFFIIPLLAQLAVFPIQLYQSYYINLMGYVANLVLVPLVTTLLMPLLLLALIFPILSFVTEPLLSSFEQLVTLMSQYLQLPWIVGSLSLSVVSVIIFVLCLTGWLVERQVHWKIWSIPLLVIVFLIETTRVCQMSSQVTFLDVGQGDSAIIQSPYQDCTIVIDTGGKISYQNETISIFNQTLKPYLLGEGVRTIDYLILSHGDQDHLGEALPLINSFKVKNLVISKYSTSDKLKEILSVAKQKGIHILTPSTHEMLTCSNQTLTFLQPDINASNENDRSLVIRLEIDEFSILFTGDISTAMENAILSAYDWSNLDVYKAAHHGSKTSNSLTFLKQLAPSMSVVSVGKNNRYGHPSKEFLEVMTELNIPLLSTLTDGTIQFKISHNQVTLHRFDN